MANLKIVILVEHLERELLFALLLKKRFAQMGHSILICNMFFDFSVIKLFKPDILFFPYFYRGNDPSVSRFFELSSVKRFYCLSWEQIFNKVQIDEKTPRDLPENLTILSWSNSWRGYLIRSGVKEKQVIQLGHPMWSLYWRYPFRSRMYFGENKNRKIYIENLDWFDSNGDRIKSSKISRNAKTNLEQLSSLVRNTIRIFHKDTFVIKVRPSSTLKRDQELSRFLFKARLVRGLPLIYYLRNATLCFGDFSSGLIDSFILGVPTYGIGIDKIPKQLTFEWQRFFSKSELIDGRKVEELYSFKSNELLTYLIDDGYINPNYLDDFIDKLDFRKNNGLGVLQFARSKFFGLVLSISHFLCTFQFFRYWFYNLTPSSLDLKTHSQDFVTSKQFILYNKLAKNLFKYFQ